MRRSCARPGCSAVATTTFTFDSREQTVWLDEPTEGGARAGELCARHTRALSPPRGWHVVDRRPPAATTSTTTPTPALPATSTTTAMATPAACAAVAPSAHWYPRFERGDDLGGVLDASTPLLSRAFRNVVAG
jgi:hypothetical protein